MRDVPDARGWIRVKKYREGPGFLHLVETTPWEGNAFTAHMWRSIVLHWAGLTDAGYPLQLDGDTQLMILDDSFSDVDLLTVRAGYPSYAGDYRARFLWIVDDYEGVGQWANLYVQSGNGITMSEFTDLVGLGSKPSTEMWTVEYEFRVS